MSEFLTGDFKQRWIKRKLIDVYSLSLDEWLN